MARASLTCHPIYTSRRADSALYSACAAYAEARCPEQLAAAAGGGAHDLPVRGVPTRRLTSHLPPSTYHLPPTTSHLPPPTSHRAG